MPLKVLSIGQNKIKKLPNEFAQLKSLEIIRFDNNGMEEFPLMLVKLNNLREIYANSNAIKIIPKEIGNLRKLKIFRMDYNKLEYIPYSV